MGKQTAAAAAPAADGEEELNIVEDGPDSGDGPLHDEEDDRVPEGADRGDELHPEDKDTDALRAVAGEGEGEGEGEDGATAGEGEGEGDGEDGGKGQMIPKPRFNEVNAALKAEREARLRLEEENARLRGTSTKKDDGKDGQQAGTEGEQQQAVDLKALRKQRMAAMMEGDEDKALEIEEQIETEIRRQAEESAIRRITEENAKKLQKQAEDDFKAAAAEMKTAYPMLDGGTAEKPNPNANPIAIAAVVQIRNQQIQAGVAPAEALRSAVEQVAEAMSLKPVGGSDGGGEGEGGAAARVDPKQTRRQQIVARNAAAARSQPADIVTTGAGRGARTANGEGDINVRDLSEEEFERLPAAEKKRLRGD